jgi:ribose transport system ATP-binding protein
MNREAADILERIGMHVSVNQPLMNLNVANQQMVAIARAVSFQSRLVIMDEPTSSLDDREVATLFDVIRQLKADGVSVIFITHRLDELYEICDRVTIMRDGKTVDECPMHDISKLTLVARMLGKELGEVRREGQTAFAEGKDPADRVLLEAEGLVRGRALRGASVSVRVGEIVGLAGLLGSGRTEVARAIFAADRIDEGEIRFDGHRTDFAPPPMPSAKASAFAQKTVNVRVSFLTFRFVKISHWQHCPSCRATASFRKSARLRLLTASSSGSRSGQPGPTNPSANSLAATSKRCCWRAGCASIQAPAAG